MRITSLPQLRLLKRFKVILLHPRSLQLLHLLLQEFIRIGRNSRILALRYGNLRAIRTLTLLLSGLGETLGIRTAARDVLVNELVALGVEQLVSVTDRAVADFRHGLNVLCALDIAHEVTGHIDASGRGRERRTTREGAELGHVGCHSDGHIRGLLIHGQHAAVALAEICWVGSGAAGVGLDGHHVTLITHV